MRHLDIYTLDEMEFAGDWTFCIMQNKRTLVELNTFNNVIQMCIRYDLLLALIPCVSPHMESIDKLRTEIIMSLDSNL